MLVSYVAKVRVTVEVEDDSEVSQIELDRLRDVCDDVVILEFLDGLSTAVDEHGDVNVVGVEIDWETIQPE